MSPWETWAAKLVAIAAGVGALLYLLRLVWRLSGRMHDLAELLKRVEAEARPNGGTSLLDALDDVKTEIKSLRETEIKPLREALRQHLDAHPAAQRGA